MKIPCILGLVAMLASSAATAAPKVVVIELDDSIQPASLRHVERGLRQAAEVEAALVIIELDTPGGLLDSLRSMTSAILGSPTPVAVYVTPSGARAASAGFFLLLASDVAAMAPGTNAGAAHPISIGQQGEAEDGVAITKATEDAAALARALAAQRGRSVSPAEDAITESRAYAAEEARRLGLIDIVATSREALLRELDGDSVKRADGATETLSLRGAEVIVLERTFAERVLSVLADPQIAYLLLMLGVLGIVFELMSPGAFVPGIIGGLSFLIGMYGLSMLPVNWIGALLILAGLGLMIAEIFVTSFGLLALSGLASFTIGSLMLVDAPVPDLQIGPGVVIPVAIALAGITALLALRAIRTLKLRPQSGLEALIGETGELIAPVDPTRDGTVLVHGEYWTATAARPLPPGSKVRIEDIEGNRLRVAALAATTREGETT